MGTVRVMNLIGLVLLKATCRICRTHPNILRLGAYQILYLDKILPGGPPEC